MPVFVYFRRYLRQRLGPIMGIGVAWAARRTEGIRMNRTKMQRVYVPHFCEGCGKEEFEGTVFGVHRVRHLQANSGDRAMYCQDCRPAPVKIPDSGLSSWFTRPTETQK